MEMAISLPVSYFQEQAVIGSSDMNKDIFPGTSLSQVCSTTLIQALVLASFTAEKL